MRACIHLSLSPGSLPEDPGEAAVVGGAEGCAAGQAGPAPAGGVPQTGPGGPRPGAANQ